MKGTGDGETLELRFHFGERDRDGGGPLEAAVMDACARRGVAAAVTLRGVEGFGARQRVRTERVLSLSEDAPLVMVAVGETARVEGLAAEVEGMAKGGLVALTPIGTTTTSAAMAAVPMGDGAEVMGSAADAPEGPGDGAEGTGAAPEGPRDRAKATGEMRTEPDLVKATVWGPRSGAGSPHLAAVAAFRARGADAATVLLGVDGVLGGERRRARFFAANRDVPAITVAIGDRASISAALADLDPAPSLVTVEPVESSSRIAGSSHHSRGVVDKWRMEPPSHHSARRTTLVTSEVAAHGAHPRYLAFIRALREEGAAGATALRGVWGFRGDGEPRGDRVLALRRDVPMLIETVDASERAARWEEIARGLAGGDDVVYSEPIPRFKTLG